MNTKLDEAVLEAAVEEVYDEFKVDTSNTHFVSLAKSKRMSLEIAKLINDSVDKAFIEEVNEVIQLYLDLRIKAEQDAGALRARLEHREKQLATVQIELNNVREKVDKLMYQREKDVLYGDDQIVTRFIKPRYPSDERGR